MTDAELFHSEVIYKETKQWNRHVLRPDNKTFYTSSVLEISALFLQAGLSNGERDINPEFIYSNKHS